MIAAGQHRLAGRRAQRGRVEPVVLQAVRREACRIGRGARASEGAGRAEAHIVDQHDQHVRRAVRSLRARDHRPVDDGLVDRAAHHAAEGAVGDRQHGAVLHELAHRLREPVLQRPHALLVALHDRFREGARERLLDRQLLIVVEDRDDPGCSGRQVLADPVVQLRLDPVVDELAHDAARSRTDRGGGEQRRRGQADGDADAASASKSFVAASMSG